MKQFVSRVCERDEGARSQRERAANGSEREQALLDDGATVQYCTVLNTHGTVQGLLCRCSAIASCLSPHEMQASKQASKLSCQRDFGFLALFLSSRVTLFSFPFLLHGRSGRDPLASLALCWAGLLPHNHHHVQAAGPALQGCVSHIRPCPV